MKRMLNRTTMVQQMSRQSWTQTQGSRGSGLTCHPLIGACIPFSIAAYRTFLWAPALLLSGVLGFLLGSLEVGSWGLGVSPWQPDDDSQRYHIPAARPWLCALAGLLHLLLQHGPHPRTGLIIFNTD